METILKEKKADFQTLKFEATQIPGMDLIEKELHSSLADSTGIIKEMCNHILMAGGKRIRPLLVLYSGLVFSEPADELVSAAVASELIHMASLVHDDIIDKSYMRRSRPSINKIWGNHFAVLCGDYLFAKAFGILSKMKLMKSMEYMVEAIENMCHGEISQAAERFNVEITREIYYKRIAQKTAIFLECCCKSGACASGASQHQIEILGEYGLNVGYAFQIIDDIMDFCGDPRHMGKPLGEDLVQGNITLPIIIMLESINYGEWIREIILKKDFCDYNNNSICRILKETGIIDEVFSIASLHINKARQCLRMLPDSQYRQFLSKLTDNLLARIN